MGWTTRAREIGPAEGGGYSAAALGRGHTHEEKGEAGLVLLLVLGSSTCLPSHIHIRFQGSKVPARKAAARCILVNYLGLMGHWFGCPRNLQITAGLRS